ncbi:MAG: hypothetical protein EA413_00325 [Cyanobium sp. PLM2.Bin73]|nr:MAG: hypothetical protein EA413_00325 [Cyanobium sp. PLM2.Bin73]
MTAAPKGADLLAAAGITPEAAATPAAPIPGTEIIPPTWPALLEQAEALVGQMEAAGRWQDSAERLDAVCDGWGALLLQDPAAKRHQGQLVATLSQHSKAGHGPTKTEAKDYLKAGAERIAQQVERVRAADRAKAAAEAFTAPPFTVKGWDPERRFIYYQVVASGHVGRLSPPGGNGSSGLLQLAPKGWWETTYGGSQGVDWMAAADAVIQTAEGRTFSPGSRRGRGVWIDASRVVWHLGDRLLVDGRPCGVGEIQTAHTYDLKAALPPLERGLQLTDAQGAAVLAALQSVGWSDPAAYLLLGGWCVVANVGGAMEYRPAVQLTAQWGKGKTTTIQLAVIPLLGGLVELLSNATEAAVRQRAKGDALPVLLDESEQGDSNGRTRAGHLRLMRHSFDGRTGGRGTAHGEVSEQRIRYSILAAGINATVPEPADRSRIVTLTRRHLPQPEWEQAERAISSAITPEIGQALIRRTVHHLRTLQANAVTLARAIERRGDAARNGDCYGTLLAGAYLLRSTEALTPEQAAAWLDRIGWTGATAQDGSEPLNEGVQCLELVLAHPIRWMEEDSPTGSISLRELAHRALAGHQSDAELALGRHGLKAYLGELSVHIGAPVTGRWLLVANDSPGLEKLLSSTRWAKGGHRLHLEQLPGAVKPRDARRFPADKRRRCTAIPWDVAFPDAGGGDD